jgi:hypothetical protein
LKRVGFEFDNSTAQFSIVDRDGNKMFTVDEPTGDISFYEDTGTTPKFFWDASAESLGIGTSSPAEVLEIRKDVASSYGSKLRITNGANYGYGAAVDFAMPLSSGGAIQTAGRIGAGYSGTDSGFLSLFTTLSGSVTERMRIGATGNVGIGTTSPSSLIHASGAAASGGAVEIRLEDTAASSNSRLMRTGSAYSYAGVGANETWLYHAGAGTINIGPDGAGAVKIVNNGSERMRIDSSGNVGIGTSSPTEKLHVSGRSRFYNLYIGEIQSNFDRIQSTSSAGLRIQSVGGDVYLDSSGNVGIGTNEPAGRLHIRGTTATDNSLQMVAGASAPVQLTMTNGYGARQGVVFRNTGSTGYTSFGMISENTALTFKTASYSVSQTSDLSTGWTERMRIDSSGNLLVGLSSTEAVGTNAGTQLRADGLVYAAATSDAHILSRRSTDGAILNFRKDTTTVGSMGTDSGTFGIHGAGSGNDAVGFLFVQSSVNPRIIPCQEDFTSNDAVISLGNTGQRFNDIYAYNGTIQTSDRNEKQDIEALSDAEQRVAVAAKGLLRKYRWIDAVAKKGDEARIHFGIIAQDLQAAFEAEGLDAGRYGMFISSTWWETTETYTDDEGVEQTRTNTYETQEEAPEGATERTRMGVRYPQLLAFIIAAL